MGLVPEPVALHDLVPLMYRADWCRSACPLTSWTDNSLRTWMLHGGLRHPPPEPEPGLPVTEVTYRVVLAPGGRYRASHLRDGAPVVQGCDGDTAWTVSPAAPGTGGLVRVMREKPGPWPVLDDLQFPVRLLSRFSLEMTGPVEAGNRPACGLTGRPRPLTPAAGPRRPGDPQGRYASWWMPAPACCSARWGRPGPPRWSAGCRSAPAADTGS
jgi:hypothetical protein